MVFGFFGKDSTFAANLIQNEDQNLTHNAVHSSCICLAIKEDYSKNNMNTDAYVGMFAIETSMILDDGIKPRTLSGNFMIDFGNPELLFLIHQTEEVQSILADNTNLELREATTPSGEVVGQFILSKQCQLCGIVFPDAVVVITKNLPLFTTPGNIGLKFFERTHAIFDFDQSVVYLKGK